MFLLLILKEVTKLIEIFFLIEIKKEIFPIFINKNFKIPLVLYQSWYTNFIPRTLAREINKFRMLNPDIKFILYMIAKSIST